MGFQVCPFLLQLSTIFRSVTIVTSYFSSKFCFSLPTSISISGPAGVVQLEVHQASRDIAVFPEPILSSADSAQRILDFVVEKRLPNAVHEDSVRNVNHELVRIVSFILMSLVLPNFTSEFEEFYLPPEKIAMTVPFVFGKVAHLLHVRVAELASEHCNCVLR